MTGFRVTRSGPVGPRRRRRGLAPRPDDLRQGDGRRLPGRGVRRPRRRDGACSRPEGPVYQAGTLSGNPVATTAGLATLRLATDEVYAHLTRGRRHRQGRRRRGADRRPASPHVVQADRHHVLGLLHRPRRPGPRLRRRLSARTPRRTPPSSTPCSTGASTCRRRRTRRGSSPPPTTTAPCRPCSTPCPTPPRAAAAAPREADPMSQTRHDRPPAAPRRGAQPRGRALRPPRRLPPLRPRPRRWPSGSPSAIGDRDIVHLRVLAARAGPGDRARRWPRPAASTS